MSKKDKRSGRRTLRQRKSVKASTYSFDEAIDLFLNVKQARNLKPRTLRDYADNLKIFCEWLSENFGSARLDDITVNVLREHVVWCAQEKGYYAGHPSKEKTYADRKGVKPSSVNVRIRVLKTFFSTLYDEEIIDHNPAEKLSLMRAEEDTVQPLTDDELRRLLNAPDQRYFSQFRDFTLLSLLLDTGCRVGEACGLEINDIKLTTREIVLPADRNKSRKSRVLPISSKTARLLKQLMKETLTNFKTDYVFVTYCGDPLNSKTFAKSLTKYAEKAMIGKRVTPHVLRHNFAKIAALNGMDIFTLQRILGHAEITTTRKYVQINDEDIRQQHDRYSPLTSIYKKLR